MASRLASALGRDPRPKQDGMAYAGGNPNFDERTGRFINQQPQAPMGQQIAQGLPQSQPQQLQRVSPGVYRGADGSLVNSQGKGLPGQPQSPMMAQQIANGLPPTQQPQQPMQPQPRPFPPGYGKKPAMDVRNMYGQLQNQPMPFARDQFPGQGFQQQIPQEWYLPAQGGSPWAQNVQQQGFNQPQAQNVDIGKSMSMQVPMPQQQQPQQQMNPWYSAMQAAYRGNR